MFEKIKKKIGIGCLVAGVLGASYDLLAGFNNLRFNYEEIGEDYYSITRADGILGKTSFIKRYGNFKGNTACQYRLNGSISVVDRGIFQEPDGLVDYIWVESKMLGGITSRLNREEDYDLFKDEFDKADKFLANTKKRFAKHFK
jgi:hypothetical protein